LKAVRAGFAKMAGVEKTKNTSKMQFLDLFLRYLGILTGTRQNMLTFSNIHANFGIETQSRT